MDKISTIKQNILLFIENQKVNKVDFFNKIDISYSNFKGKSLYSEIGADKLVKIMTSYPEINPDWLLTGKGEMLRSVGTEVVKKENVHPHTAELVEMQRKEILRLENDLQKCKEEKKIFENNRTNV